MFEGIARSGEQGGMQRTSHVGKPRSGNNAVIGFLYNECNVFGNKVKYNVDRMVANYTAGTMRTLAKHTAGTMLLLTFPVLNFMCLGTIPCNTMSALQYNTKQYKAMHARQ